MVAGNKHGIQYYENGEPYRKGVWDENDEFISVTEFDPDGREIFQGKLHHNSI